MKLPGPLDAALAAADDNYLIGLCNKGTVNRAKKDLAALAEPSVTVTEEGAQVQMGDVTCQICAPLGESRCSCPSSGICRHRITAILWLKQQAQGEEDAPGPEAEPPKPTFETLRAYPADKLAKQLGPKRLAAALFRQRSGTGPSIEETSVVTVEMPWIPAAVRLLDPLEHSTCTCHSKTFCIHKAEALLYWQMSRNILDPAALEAARPPEEELDLEAVRGVCQAVQQTLAAQMATGLSRMPAGVCETVERMAALCHTARLPALERALRGVHGEYQAYFARSASYRDTALLMRLSRAFRLAAALETADPKAALDRAGRFRDDYEAVGDLELYLLGQRDFDGRSGYAGTIYYFWERQEQRFYTYADVRPTFYEGKARRRTAAVPWGLPCTLGQAWNCGLNLSGAKASRDRALSATEQCRAVLLGRQNPDRVIPAKAVCTDFEWLLRERSGPHDPEVERLAVVRPARCLPQDYDQVRQVFSIRLVDGAGRDLFLEVHYKKEEEKVVEALEQLARRLRRKPDFRPVFFGLIYREEDRLKLYPIEYFAEWEECL